jgi:hypothetical protein
MKIQFSRKFAALLSLAVLTPTLAWLIKDSYKIAIITKESVAAYDLWQTGQEIAVELETTDNQVIGLSHWSPSLAETNLPFFFEPTQVDGVFSCYPELLSSEIQEKHLFGNKRGLMFVGRVGQVVVFTSGVL